MVTKFLGIVFLVWLVVFIVKMLVELKDAADINAFMNQWVKRTAWIWLPFYSLVRLIKEVILEKK